jgi:hypothetical protein
MSDETPDKDDEAREDAARLAVYDLAEVHRANLTLDEGERLNLTLRGAGKGRYKEAARFLPVASVTDLKRFIGVPDAVMRHRCRCPEGLSEAFPPGFERIEDLSPTQRDVLRAATDAYVHGDSETVAHYVPAIDKALTLVGRAKVSIVLFADIVVERDAVLTVAPSIDVLFANKVRIKQGGRIRFRSRLKIDCLSIQGDEGFTVYNPALLDQPALISHHGG